jgi:transcriptional regulator with XRE-family HTH domain
MESGMNTTGFGYFLRDIRENGKISLRKLAQETQLDPAYLSRMEREMSPAPRVEIVQRLAKALCGLQNLSMAECEKLKRDLLDSAGQLTESADLIDDLKQRFAERLRDQGMEESYIVDAVSKVSLETMDRILSGLENLEIGCISHFVPGPDYLPLDEIEERKSKGEEVHLLKMKEVPASPSPRKASKAVKKTKFRAGSRAFIEVDGDLTPYQEELLRSITSTVRLILKEK